MEEYLRIKNDYFRLINSNFDEINQEGGKAVIKWNNLEHNGVMFYEEYSRHNIPIYYDGKEIKLNSESEEFMTYYVNPRFDKYRNNKFTKNFFKDWKKLLSESNKKIIEDFEKINYDSLRSYVIESIEKKREGNKLKSKEEKNKEKLKRDEEIEKYKYAIVDGSKISIDNFIVEPPTIFMGRGSHPKTGSIKKRIYPEDIILNVSKDMKIPKVYINGTERKWGDIITDNTIEWIASWQNNVTEKNNYARFGKKSEFKARSDEAKYDLARKLKKKIKKIRINNEIKMNSSDTEEKQLATALFLIDRLALRIGNEKKSSEADTVGITTLKIKNIDLLENDIVKLDFLGKDSIRYVNRFKVPLIVYNNLKLFIKNKKNSDDLFDLITSDSLNKYIRKYMRKLTSKVFRTYNASYLMSNELRRIYNKYKDYEDDDLLKKILHEYEDANIKVAKLCNHQKLSTTNMKSLNKLIDNIKNIKNELNRLKREKKKLIENNKSTKSINKKINTRQERLRDMKKKKDLMEKSKNLSTGTSKTNYIDPRITISFLKKINLMDSIDKFFSKSQQNQFEWALSTDENYKF
jgi:DNA topoisomerase-1